MVRTAMFFEWVCVVIAYREQWALLPTPAHDAAVRVSNQAVTIWKERSLERDKQKQGKLVSRTEILNRRVWPPHQTKSNRCDTAIPTSIMGINLTKSNGTGQVIDDLGGL